MTRPLPDPVYFAGLPRKTVSAGCIIRNDAGHILLVKPTYKSGWEVPGGVCEADEAPRVTAAREAREELGIDVAVGRALCIDHANRVPPLPDGLHFLFDGGILAPDQITAINLPAAELSEFRFVAREQILTSGLNAGVARRVDAALRALATDQVLYLEDGRMSGTT